ncbi:MAG: alpha/beta hydrolase [Alphaproteobacteria bacterium]|jgi:pimeloyl-ACP methyl ester carboxylesterase|nr:alpha/beta hydrolase [Alphaproteobacteria bacterium]MDP6516520.1 alpha/beta hydrolase [Alphaproteobacteria bacterium]
MRLAVESKSVHAGTGGFPIDIAKPLTVFVHGAGMDHTVWALQTRYFANHGQSVLAVDMPGHGRSDGPALTSVGAMADWLGQLIGAAGFEQAMLVGHSMGAIATLEAAARHPDQVRKLALLGAAPTMPVHPDLLAAARDDIDLAVQFIVSWAYGTRAHIGGTQAPGLWMLAGGRRLLHQAAPGVLATDFAACADYAGGAAAAARVRAPTLILCGDSDRMTPARESRKFEAAIAEARLVMIPGGGHMMMVEQPDATLDALKAFL